MKRHEILRLYPNASEAFIAANIEAGSKWVGARPVVQELQKDLRKKANHTQEGGGSNESRNGRFRVAITLLVSDKRDRDGDGAASTIFDCLLDSAGRLIGVDRGTLRKMAKSEERRRGRSD